MQHTDALSNHRRIDICQNNEHASCVHISMGISGWRVQGESGGVVYLIALVATSKAVYLQRGATSKALIKRGEILQVWVMGFGQLVNWSSWESTAVSCCGTVWMCENRHA